MVERIRAGAVHPELRRAFRFVPNPPIRQAWLLWVMQWRLWRLFAQRMPAGVRREYVRIAEGAAVHVYRPAAERPSRPALLWIHGGGMVVGGAAQDHARCVAVVRHLDAVVVSVEYGLAPRDRFPAALEDCHAAWEWMVANADRLGVDPARISVGGQSARGGLAAGLVQRLVDQGGVLPVAQWLFCPMLDDRTAADRGLDAVRHFLWDNVSNRVGWTAYLGVDPGAETLPDYASPARRTDLTGLPPAWIGTGDIELFYEEDRRYADALRRAGVACVLDTVPGAPHAFESIQPRSLVARSYVARAERWLATRLAASAGSTGPATDSA